MLKSVVFFLFLPHPMIIRRVEMLKSIVYFLFLPHPMIIRQVEMLKSVVFFLFLPHPMIIRTSRNVEICFFFFLFLPYDNQDEEKCWNLLCFFYFEGACPALAPWTCHITGHKAYMYHLTCKLNSIDTWLQANHFTSLFTILYTASVFNYFRKLVSVLYYSGHKMSSSLVQFEVWKHKGSLT